MARDRTEGKHKDHKRGPWVGRRILRHVGFIASVLVVIALLVALRIADPIFVSNARQTAFDFLQRISPRKYTEAPVKIVDIDERSLRELGQWPWPRKRLAELVDRLHAAGAAAVAFDFLFVEPDRVSPSQLLKDPAVRSALGVKGKDTAANLPNYDEIFADAIKNSNVVLGFGTSPEVKAKPPVKAGFAYTGADPAAFVSRLRGGARLLPVLAKAAAGIGSTNISKESSVGTVREIPLIWSDGKRLYPSLSSEALRVAQGAQTYVVHADPQGRVHSIRIGAFNVPTGPAGDLYLYYTHSRRDRYISAVDLFNNDQLRKLAPKIRGRIMLIGTSAAGLFDIHKTALGESVPGVEIHAQALEQILTGQFLQRHDWTRAVELLALALGCLIVSMTTMYGGARVSFAMGGVVCAIIAGGAWYAFRNEGILIDYSYPIVGTTAMWFLATAYRYIIADKEKRLMRNVFSRYVHPTVLKDIERNHSQVRLGGENCELTVLFTDVRNFTPLSERLTPEELVEFLNTLLGRLGGEITRESGVIDKFIGDSVMAFWNAPLRQSDHARLACAAALKMRSAMREMSAQGGFALPEEVARDASIEIGVGINTGPACVGNVGSAERFNYSAIGDAVNIAARAESACKELAYDLVVCRSTAEQVPDFAFLDAGGVPLKGKTEPVRMTILVGDEAMKSSPQFQQFVRRYEALIEALKKDRPEEAEKAMEECQGLVEQLEPGLQRYLDRIPRRRKDFALKPSAELAGASTA